MKLAQADHAVERDDATTDVSFKIKASGKAFKILSDSLYTDKPAAIIRELSCNAYDAHVAAGKKDEPFLVKLPTPYDPTLTIRDYGIGLSHNDVVTIATTYFESTKTTSNDFVGALGLGSKSPFSYVDSYTITSYFNGVKRMYCAFIDSDDTPKITLLNGAKISSEGTSEEIQVVDGVTQVKVDGVWWNEGDFSGELTDEPNGLEISMPVKTHDITTFKEKAKEIFFFFETKPKTIPELSYPEYTVTTNGDGWEIINYTNYYDSVRPNSVVAVQGNVAYAVNMSALQLAKMSAKGHRFLRKIAESIQYHRGSSTVILRFKIGELEVAASREGLSYKDLTFSSLDRVAVAMADQIKASVDKNIDSCATLWEAMTLVNDSYREGIYSICGVFEWKGTKVEQTISAKVADLGQTATFYAKNYGRKTLYLATDIKVLSASVYRYDQSVIVVSDVKNTNSRVRHALSTGSNGLSTNRNCTIVCCDDPKAMKASIEAALGGFPVLMGSDLEEPPKAVRAKNTSVGNVRHLNFYHGRISVSQHRSTVKMDDGGIYIDVESSKPMWSTGVMMASNHSDLLSFIGFSETVVVPYTKDLKDFKSNNKWKTLNQAVKEKLADTKVVATLNSKLASIDTTKLGIYTRTIVSSSAIDTVVKQLPKSHALVELVSDVSAAIRGNYTVDSPVVKLLDSEFGIKLTTPNVTVDDVNKRTTALMEVYPFIIPVVSSWCNSDSIAALLKSINTIDDLRTKAGIV